MNSCEHNQVRNVCVVIAVIIPKSTEVKYSFLLNKYAIISYIILVNLGQRG